MIDSASARKIEKKKITLDGGVDTRWSRAMLLLRANQIERSAGAAVAVDVEKTEERCCVESCGDEVDL